MRTSHLSPTAPYMRSTKLQLSRNLAPGASRACPDDGQPGSNNVETRCTSNPDLPLCRTHAFLARPSLGFSARVKSAGCKHRTRHTFDTRISHVDCF